MSFGDHSSSRLFLAVSLGVIGIGFSLYFANSASAILKLGLGLPEATSGSNNILSQSSIPPIVVSDNSSQPALIYNEPKVAIIDPTFTGAAYDNSFYNFFKKYRAISSETVTQDLGLLSKTVPSKSNQESAITHLKEHLIEPSKYNVTILTDSDVHQGLIFSKGNSTNAYDVLVLFHSEYVTQEEYQNIKTFVANGGTLFVMDGNVFYAEVRYDNNTKTITLVKGHGWEFDGKSAQRSIGERWANETTEWMGSNYLCYSCKIAFGNNPFGYLHHEEQYITNPNVTIIQDYKPIVADYGVVSDVKIATYELNYGKGKVVVMGLYSSDILQNPQFFAFFDDIFPKGSIHD